MQNLMEEFKLTNRRAFTKKILFAGLGIPLLSSFRFLDSSENLSIGIQESPSLLGQEFIQDIHSILLPFFS